MANEIKCHSKVLDTDNGGLSVTLDLLLTRLEYMEDVLGRGFLFAKRILVIQGVLFRRCSQILGHNHLYH